MADISKITDITGTTYDIKDTVARRVHDPDALETKTYTDVIATANDNQHAGFFYMKVRGTTFTEPWHIKVRVTATIPGNVHYFEESIFDAYGFAATYSWYSCLNWIRSTSYRPIYYNSLFLVSETGYNNGCGTWVGINLVSATKNLDTNFKRTIVVDLLQYEGCTVEMQNSLITPDDIPNRSEHTNWYSSTNTSFANFDACNNGLKQTGDANTTNISNLYLANGNYIADSAVYRYQMLFQKDENTLTPLNNDNNATGTTKTMLTNVEFNPFGKILYYSSTTTVLAEANIGAGALFFSINGLDMRYTFNITTTTFIAHRPVYLIVVPTSNGKCKIVSANPLTQTIPSIKNGNWYILLGRAYSGYQMALHLYHPVYMYDGTKLREVLPETVYLNANNLSSGTIPEERLPIASADSVGGIKVGSNLSISNGILSAVDTTYESKTAASGGTEVSLVTTGEKYAWNTMTAGTVSAVQMNETTYSPTNGIINLGTVITSHQDISGKANISDITHTASTIADFVALFDTSNVVKTVGISGACSTTLFGISRGAICVAQKTISGTAITFSITDSYGNIYTGWYMIASGEVTLWNTVTPEVKITYATLTSVEIDDNTNTAITIPNGSKPTGYTLYSAIVVVDTGSSKFHLPWVNGSSVKTLFVYTISNNTVTLKNNGTGWGPNNTVYMTLFWHKNS